MYGVSSSPAGIWGWMPVSSGASLTGETVNSAVAGVAAPVCAVPVEVPVEKLLLIFRVNVSLEPIWLVSTSTSSPTWRAPFVDPEMIR